MNKRKAVYALVGGLLVTGLVFNAPTMAAYKENLGTATQTINAATWDVEFGNNLGTHTIFPGDVISEDTITLTNNNDYAVKYTITLSSTDNGLKEALTLDVKDGQGKSYGNTEKTGEITVEAGKTIKLNSHVTWTSSEEENKDISYQGKSAQYHYDIVAESLKATYILEDVSAYWSNDRQITTTFKLNENLDLSTSSNDNVIIQYLNENGESVTLRKDKTWSGYLNEYLEDGTRKQYPRGILNDKKYSNDINSNTYSSTTNYNETDKYKNATKVRVTVIKDGVEYEKTVPVRK